MAGNFGKPCQEHDLGVFVLDSGLLAWPRLVTGEAPRSGLLNPNTGKSGSGRDLLRTSLGIYLTQLGLQGILMVKLKGVCIRGWLCVNASRPFFME